MATQTLGLVGLGAMGAPIARNLLRAGYSLLVCDVDEEATQALVSAGAKCADSPAAMAAVVPTVALCLPSLGAIEEVVAGERGLIHGNTLRTCINFSTAGPAFVEQLATRLQVRGVTLMDCPITGGAAGARDGTLSITISGDKRAYDDIKPLLETLARHLFYIGERPGQAQLLKLLNNMLSFTALAASCEALVVAAKAGLDLDQAVAVINTGTGRNSATTDKLPNNILPRTFDYGAKLAISQKDIALCLEQAQHYGVPMWVGSMVKQLIDFAVAQDGDQVDVSTLIRHYEKWAGVEVAGKASTSRTTTE